MTATADELEQILYCRSVGYGSGDTLTSEHFCGNVNKYVDPAYCQTEIYADRVACCPLVSHCEYVDGTDRQMDGRQAFKLCFPLDAASVTRGQHVLRWPTAAKTQT